MATFSFGFQFPAEDGAATTTAAAPAPTAATTAAAEEEVTRIPARMVDIGDTESVDMTVPTEEIKVTTEGGETLTFLKVDEELAHISEALADVLDDAEDDTDLVPHVYEGGLKVWECSLDLVRYLSDNSDTILSADASDAHSNKRCLELGCGHGFPGIQVLKTSPHWTVCFTDLNDDVLTVTTWPNIAMNVRGNLKDRFSFVCGDWLAMDQVLPDPTFDLILTAETIYTERHCTELAMLLDKHLSRSPHARALVACKRYYFGTGGGTNLFRQACTKQGSLEVTSAKIFDDGKSNIREILEVKRPEATASEK